MILDVRTERRSKVARIRLEAPGVAVMLALAGLLATGAEAAKLKSTERTQIQEPRPIDVPSDEVLEAQGAIIGRIELDVRQIFDERDERENSTDWYPFRLARFGAAIFGDVGRTWGSGMIGNSDPGTLQDIGCGMRFGNTRSGLGNVLHVDLAFPLNGDRNISRVQFLVQTKASY